jgi:SAM-dependent methyltransferase
VSITYYADLLRSSERIHAFRRAIEEEVREGDRVLEIGTGLGTFAFFAARAGAAKVYAVEAGPVVQVAETLAVANGLSGSVEVVRGRIPDLTIPEAVDLVVFEDFPVVLLDVPTYELLRRVQDEYLAPGGRMLPARARLGLAPIQSSSLYEETFPLDGEDADTFGLDWSALRPMLANAPRGVRLSEGVLRGKPVHGAPIRLLPVPAVEDLTVEAEWTVGEAGAVHGLATWFDLELSDARWISNGPTGRAGPWGQVFLPFDQPLLVASGSTVEARVTREADRSGAPSWLAWECRCGAESRSGHEFGGALLETEKLRLQERRDAGDR